MSSLVGWIYETGPLEKFGAGMLIGIWSFVILCIAIEWIDR